MRMRVQSAKSLRRQAGVSLIEALLAAVLLAIGLLGTIGLQARAYSALSDAGLRAEATIAADQLLGVMSADPTHLGDYALAAGEEPGERLSAWYQETRARIPGASMTVIDAAHIANVEQPQAYTDAVLGFLAQK